MCFIVLNNVSKTIRPDFKGKRNFNVGDFNLGENNKPIIIKCQNYNYYYT